MAGCTLNRVWIVIYKGICYSWETVSKSTIGVLSPKTVWSKFGSYKVTQLLTWTLSTSTSFRWRIAGCLFFNHRFFFCLLFPSKFSIFIPSFSTFRRSNMCPRSRGRRFRCYAILLYINGFHQINSCHTTTYLHWQESLHCCGWETRTYTF